MNVLSQTLEKLGFSQFDSNANTTKLSFDDVADQQVRKELLLIQQVKLYQDFLAEEQLIAMYRGMLNKLVNDSRAKQLAGYDQTFQRAVSSLKSCIRKFELSSYKKNKPSTYFTSSINLELDKFYKSLTSQNVVKMSGDLNQNKNTIVNAESILTSQLGRAPTNEETLNFIKNDLGYGKNLDLKKMERIQHYNTKEYSGSAAIGQENAGGAEVLTFEDVANSTESADEILSKDTKEQKIINAIRDFTQNKDERRFLIAYLGIGEFKNNISLKGNAFRATMETGISYYVGNKLLDSFRTYCAERGVF